MKITRGDLRSIIKEMLLREERVHTVKGGDLIGKIARQYDVTKSMIASANPQIEDLNKISIGQEIIIPEPLERLNSHLKTSPRLEEWMRYEEGKMDRAGKGTGEPHLTSYNDKRGYLTIGYGRKQRSQTRQTIDKDFAIELLKKDLLEASEIIRDSTTISVSEHATIPIRLSQNQFDALTSLVFNSGRGNYIDSTLHNQFISKGIISGPEFDRAFLNFSTPEGFGGIPKRRSRELAMFKGRYVNK